MANLTLNVDGNYSKNTIVVFTYSVNTTNWRRVYVYTFIRGNDLLSEI